MKRCSSHTFVRNTPGAVRGARPGLVSIAFVMTALFGCRSFEPATPPGFVEFEDRYEGHEYRASSADGVVLGVRAFENEPKGELAFWSRVIENRMRNIGGYALLEKRTVRCRGELAGTQMRFGHDEGKEPHLYYLTVFVGEKRVFILEAGGLKSEMDRLAPQIDWSVRNFLPK